MGVVKTLREQVVEERRKSEALAARNAELEDALCETDTAADRRMADIEDALCELDKE